MAEKGFGVKEINLIGASGTPTIESPNNLNLNAVNVAISTNVSIGGTLSVTGNVSVGGTLTYEDVTNIDSVGIITARTGVKVLAGGINVTGVVTATGADINGNSNIAGNLTVEKTSGATELQVKGGESSNAFIHLRADEGDNNGDSWLLKAEASGNDFVIQNDVSGSPVDKFTITTSGAVTATSFSGDGSALTGIAVTEAPAVDYTITANGSSAYLFHGGGVDETANNPDLYLIRGQKYRFNNTTGSSHPFAIREASGGSAYSNGVTGSQNGIQFFTVPYDAPAKIFYQCTIHGGMVGNIYIRGAGGQNDNVGLTTFSGQITASDHINLASTKKLSMAGDVFKIYHSTNAAIINESGDFIINQNVSNKRIKISTGSGPTESVRITPDGRMKVGFINNVDPTTVFDVMASAVNQDIVRFTGANHNRGLLISTAANGGVNDCDIIYDAVSTASKGKHTFKTDGTTRLHIDEHGYLIKAAGKTAAFNVKGTNMARSNSNAYIVEFNDNSSTGCFDSGDNFNTSTYKFKAPVTGIYYFFTNIRLDQYSTGYIRTAFLSTNYGTGSTFYNYPETGHVISYPTNNNIMHISTSTVVQLDKDDEVYVWQDPSADNSYTVYLAESSFGGYLIG